MSQTILFNFRIIFFACLINVFLLVPKDIYATSDTIGIGGSSLRLLFNSNGGIAAVVIGGRTFSITGQTELPGCKTRGKVKIVKSGNTISFGRLYVDSAGHQAVVTDKFAPAGKGISWQVDVKSDDAPWTVAIVSALRSYDIKNTVFWTALGTPDLSATGLDPQLADNIQKSKTTNSSSWSDPLVPFGFVNRIWHYGNVGGRKNVPIDDDYTELPLFSFLFPKTDNGISLVLSPEDVLLKVDLLLSANGNAQFARTQYRLGNSKTISFHMTLTPHEADWRGGLRFLVDKYPQYFDAPVSKNQLMVGCGAYSSGEEMIDVRKFKKMSFGFNWKLSDDFPYMGMFIPPVKSMDEVWTRSCGEPSAAYLDSTTSCRRMNDYALYMKKNGFSVLSYFNATEFGKDMNSNGLRVAQRLKGDPELWKDPAAFVKYTMPEAIVDPKMEGGYAAYVMDPGESRYQEFILEQAKRNCDMLPATDGICIDRADWLSSWNLHADDGISLVEGRPARSLLLSWINLMEKLGPMMHRRNKVIFSNLMTVRLELMKHLDGIYAEYGQNGNALNSAALLCLRKPAICWTYNATLNEPDPDAFMQRHLYMGCFPTAPFPHNNHCITPEPAADSLYIEYGALLNAIRGKKWVLAPHCVEASASGVKVNLFEVPGGYALPVTFGGAAGEVEVVVRNIDGVNKLHAEAVLPGVEAPVAIQSKVKNNTLVLKVPLKQGCAMVKLRK
jgi:hypothetical protein